MSYIRRYAKEHGLEIVEAMGPMEVEVLPVDINNGVRKNHKSCAFACALKRQFRTTEAHVLPTTAYVKFNGQLVRFRLPPKMRAEVESFDRTGVVNPGHYMLRAFCPQQRLGAKRVVQNNANRTGKPPVKGKRKARPVGIRSLYEPVAVH